MAESPRGVQKAITERFSHDSAASTGLKRPPGTGSHCCSESSWSITLRSATTKGSTANSSERRRWRATTTPRPARSNAVLALADCSTTTTGRLRERRRRSFGHHGRHVLDDHRRQDVLANVASFAPPLRVDKGGNDGQGAAPNDGPERLRGAALAPLEGDQHAGVERKGHATRRRDLFGGSSPRHSASMRSTASSSSGGTPYLSKYASAATNFAEQATGRSTVPREAPITLGRSWPWFPAPVGATPEPARSPQPRYRWTTRGSSTLMRQKAPRLVSAEGGWRAPTLGLSQPRRPTIFAASRSKRKEAWQRLASLQSAEAR